MGTEAEPGIAGWRPLRRPALKQEVAQHIRDSILAGEVRPGQRIDQDGIAADLGLSRLPVREALIMLEAEGLVENRVRRGSYVAALERDDLVDHYEMYGLLSGMAAARVASRDTTELVARLDEVMAGMRATADASEHDRLNFRFHELINRAGSSRRLRAVLRMLARSMPTSFFAQNTEWDWRDRALDEHDGIVAALRDGDGRRAAEAMAEHFRHTGEHAVHLLEQSGFWEAGEA